MGDWIVKHFNTRVDNEQFKALIANCAWGIWKTRCNLVFKRINPNFTKVFQKAILFIKDVRIRVQVNITELFPMSFSNFCISTFCDALQSDDLSPSGLGFVMTTNIILAGAISTLAESSLQSESKAIILALKHCYNRLIHLDYIFTNYIELANLIMHEDSNDLADERDT